MEADDGHAPAADAIVTVGSVSIALSQVVVHELAEAGIQANAVEERVAYGGPMQTRILCFGRDRDAAAAIIDRIFAEIAASTPHEPDDR